MIVFKIAIVAMVPMKLGRNRTSRKPKASPGTMQSACPESAIQRSRITQVSFATSPDAPAAKGGEKKLRSAVRTGGTIAAALSGCLMLFAQGAKADPDTSAAPGPELTYQQLCSDCHGEQRYGGYAPPLIPATLQRKQDDVLVRAILDGLPSTQMPAFGKQLKEDDARAIVALFRRSPGEVSWTLADIAASRAVEEPGARILGPEVDRTKLILVVERGTGSVSVLDGDSLEEIDRFFVGRIHGGIKFDHDFHRALAVTRDGTLVQYDLDRGAPRAGIRVDVNTRNIATSSDGQFVAAANQLPQSLVILNGSLVPLALFPLDGQPSAVYQVPGRQRFIVTLRDRPKIYFVELPGLQIQSVQIEEPLEDFVFVPGQPQLVASSRGGDRLVLYDYARNVVVDSLPVEGLPHLFSASFFEHEACYMQSSTTWVSRASR